MPTPERTCVGCHERAEQRGLLRSVRRPDGTLVVDALGSEPGRGAYVHRDPTCVEAAFARGSLLRSLRAGGDVDGAARLRSMIEQALGAH